MNIAGYRGCVILRLGLGELDRIGGIQRIGCARPKDGEWILEPEETCETKESAAGALEKSSIGRDS